MERDAVMKRVFDYPLVGALGSQGPKLPVCEEDILAELNDPTSTLSESCGKRNISSWAKRLISRVLCINHQDAHHLRLDLCVYHVTLA